MAGPEPRRSKSFAVFCWALFTFLPIGCTAYLAGVPTGAVMGRYALDDYSPSVILSGNTEQFWWCGQGSNPDDPSQTSDTIQYAALDLATGKSSTPLTVMAETPNAWDSAYTCNPQVVGGEFVNPLGDGETWSYAMYYVGTALHSGLNNSIGVAFSNDAIHWRKYPHPVIVSPTAVFYGVGQPAPYNADHKSGIRLFYEYIVEPGSAQHYEATSNDGVHFEIAGRLTTNGINPNGPPPSWGDIAFDPNTGSWYAAFNMPVRNKATTANYQERGQFGVTLYRIPADSLLTGITPWQQLHTFDTNATGNESNFIAAFLRDRYGNLNVGPYPTIELFTSISNPRPGWSASVDDAAGSSKLDYWDIGEVEWTPNQSLRPLNAYSNKTVHEATTGWVDPDGEFAVQSTLGYLYESPQNGATRAFYGCKNGSQDYFISTDSECEGQRVLGIQGYGYAQPQPGQSLAPLYRCSTGHDHYVSATPQCEGGDAAGILLGYAVK